MAACGDNWAGQRWHRSWLWYCWRKDYWGYCQNHPSWRHCWSGDCIKTVCMSVILSVSFSENEFIASAELTDTFSTSGWPPAQWRPHPENRRHRPARHGQRTGGPGPQAVRQQGEAGGDQGSCGGESLHLCCHACGAPHCQWTTGEEGLFRKIDQKISTIRKCVTLKLTSCILIGPSF